MQQGNAISPAVVNRGSEVGVLLWRRGAKDEGGISPTLPKTIRAQPSTVAAPEAKEGKGGVEVNGGSDGG